MNLNEQILRKRTKIVRLWYGHLLESYPRQSRKFIALDTDRFANPIGFTLSDGVERVFDHLLGGRDIEEIEESLAQIVKLRAIQEGSHANALEFLLALKKIIREQCGVNSSAFTQVDELLAIEDRIDEVFLLAHELYVRSRESIAELKVNEMRNKTYMLRKMVGEI